jgi:hypothetical protein
MSTGFLFFCCDERRRAEVRGASGALNGIDYLEVADGQRLLRVHFVKPPAPELTDPAAGIRAENVRIAGGERIRQVPVDTVEFAGELLEVRVEQPGDFSVYTLYLATSDGGNLPGLDPLLSAVNFSFKVDCPSDFDCAPQRVCPPPAHEEPEIDYLAKDYASFRQLMLDRLALLLPAWTERNPADVGVTLVELLAYVGDQLSYTQDAVATEAYLGTARRRVSVRRHAALLDYAMHDGCNARVWVHVDVEARDAAEAAAGILLPRSTVLFTQLPGSPRAGPAGSREDREAQVAGPEFFETMHAARLWPAHRRIPFHTWGNRECCLPRGATRATLAGEFPELRRHDVLVFEEVVGPRTGGEEDADAGHRHAVRLTEEPIAGADPLTGDPVTEIAWGTEDALPFSLCLSATLSDGRYLENVSVARANMVLADHGRSIVAEQVGTPAPPDPRLAPAAARQHCGAEAAPPPPPRFRPRLEAGPVSCAARIDRTAVVEGRRERLFFDPEGSADSAFRWEMRQALPVVSLRDSRGRLWSPRRDLLGSGSFSLEFVVEVEDDGRAALRFGDGRHGARPTPGVQLVAELYRVGNGTRGNVAADSIRHLVTADPDLTERILSVRNPLPARGGTEPELPERVRQNAPAALRTQERAVTPEDYARAAERHPEVQRAQATVRWTGSWRTLFLSVDRLGGREVDPAFQRRLSLHLERYRLAGHDLEIDGPRYVPLEVELFVCVLPGYFRSHVRAALLEALSNRDLPQGGRGLFHPDRFTFGQPVYLSHAYTAAQEVAGVRYAEVRVFRRLGERSRAALEAGELTVGRLEIVRLDNDPSSPERGVLRLQLEGGR